VIHSENINLRLSFLFLLFKKYFSIHFKSSAVINRLLSVSKLDMLKLSHISDYDTAVTIL